VDGIRKIKKKTLVFDQKPNKKSIYEIKVLFKYLYVKIQYDIP